MAKKLIFDCDEDLWNRVLKYKIDSGSANNNEAMRRLVKKGLSKV